MSSTPPNDTPARPAPERDEPVPTRRVIIWSVVGLVVALGIALYFVYGRRIAPLMG